MKKLYIWDTNTLCSGEEIDVYFYYSETEDKKEYFWRYEFYWKKTGNCYISLDEFYLNKNDIKQNKLLNLFNEKYFKIAKDIFNKYEKSL